MDAKYLENDVDFFPLYQDGNDSQELHNKFHQYGADDKRVHQSTTLELIKPSMGYIYIQRERERELQ